MTMRVIAYTITRHRAECDTCEEDRTSFAVRQDARDWMEQHAKTNSHRRRVREAARIPGIDPAYRRRAEPRT